MNRVPETVDVNVQRLIDRIKSDESPVYLKVTPEPYAEINECIPAVRKKIEKDGGAIQFGWQVWQIPNMIIEGEFHAVWKSPTGDLADITPKKYQIDRILFVPDSNAKYDGAQRNNIRLNISSNRLVDDFIQICNAQYRLLNKGDRAYKNEVVLSDEESDLKQILEEAKAIVSTMFSRGATRNSPCICGSGLKYKRCHGSALTSLLSKV